MWVVIGRAKYSDTFDVLELLDKEPTEPQFDELEELYHQSSPGYQFSIDDLEVTTFEKIRQKFLDDIEENRKRAIKRAEREALRAKLEQEKHEERTKWMKDIKWLKFDE